MNLKNIGEFGLISKIAKMTKPGRAVVKGIGDDCAVLKFNKRQYLLFTTDMILEGSHFLRTAVPEKIGHKAIAVNISDIASCGGVPKWAVIAVGLPKALSAKFALGIYKGIEHTADKFGVQIVGGDTNLADKLTISVALLGVVNKENLTLRCNARPGDYIFITNKLVRADKDLVFMPRLKESRALVGNFKINSMIDISDGLLSDLGHVLDTSGVSAVLYESLIPCSDDNKLPLLSKGEQFELLFTADKFVSRKIIRRADSLGIDVSVIGEIRERSRHKLTLVSKKGRISNLEPKGYKHF